MGPTGVVRVVGVSFEHFCEVPTPVSHILHEAGTAACVTLKRTVGWAFHASKHQAIEQDAFSNDNRACQYAKCSGRVVSALFQPVWDHPTREHRVSHQGCAVRCT